MSCPRIANRHPHGSLALVVGLLTTACPPGDGDTGEPDTTGAPDSSSGPTVITSGVDAGETDPNPDDSSSTGDTTASTSTGDTASPSGPDTTSIGGDTTTNGDTGDTGDTGDDATTGGDTGDADLEDCCDVGCTTTLLQSHTTDVKVSRSATRITTQGGGTLVLYDAATLARIARLTVEDTPRLLADRLLYRSSGTLHLLDAADAAELGSMPAAAEYGLALDGGYVWTADAIGLTVYEPGGGVRWTVAGDFTDLSVQAMPDVLHVFAEQVAPHTIQRFATADGAVTTTAFLGEVLYWFEGNPRFWTMKNGVHRFYDLDGALLFEGMGYPVHGWGSRYVLNDEVHDVSAPDVVIGEVTHPTKIGDGPFLASGADANGKVRVTNLGEDPIHSEVLQLTASQYDEKLSLAFAGDAWVAGGEAGQSLDDLGRHITRGPVVSLAGAQTGRYAYVYDHEIHVEEVAADCTATAHPPFVGDGELRISGDGEVLIAKAWYSPNPNLMPRFGSRFYALPGGELVAETHLGLHSDTISDHDISDDGTVWSRYWFNTAPPGSAHSNSLPFGYAFTSLASDVLPKVAPGGLHIVESDGVTEYLDDWDGDKSRIWPADIEAEDPIAEFDGIAHGFIDDQHILAAEYVGPNYTFTGMRIVDLAGLDVQDVDLPDIRRILRVGTGEILAQVGAPVFAAVIFDPWTAEQLWVGPQGVHVELAGPDFVLFVRDDRIELHRWR